MLERIKDSKISFDSTDTGNGNNLVISRDQLSDGENNGIGVGYEFSDGPRRLKSVMVVKGCSATNHTEDDSVYMSEKDENIAVYYYKDSNWFKLQPSEYIECVERVTYGKYYIYPGPNNFKPGEGIFSSRASFFNANDETVRSYLIFNSTIEAEKILVVDHSKNSFLNVSEMAVFEDEPGGDAAELRRESPPFKKVINSVL